LDVTTGDLTHNFNLTNVGCILDRKGRYLAAACGEALCVFDLSLGYEHESSRVKQNTAKYPSSLWENWNDECKWRLVGLGYPDAKHRHSDSYSYTRNPTHIVTWPHAESFVEEDGIPIRRVITARPDHSLQVWQWIPPHVTDSRSKSSSKTDSDPFAVEVNFLGDNGREPQDATFHLTPLDPGFVATANYDRKVHIWDTRNPAKITQVELKGHTRGLSCVCYIRPDTIVSGGMDGDVRVWSMSRQVCLVTFAEDGYQTAVAVNACDVNL